MHLRAQPESYLIAESFDVSGPQWTWNLEGKMKIQLDISPTIILMALYSNCSGDDDDSPMLWGRSKHNRGKECGQSECPGYFRD